ncbi:uncharacterized protein LOC134457231 isoform X2 [Engraulis encrasicolus]|uniref:uncharacterized protein LOC134457231 isoform X2 n=1 Tax=Engraulis encrasicolus TaxID=184585 RepID=UPI002FD3E58C
MEDDNAGPAPSPELLYLGQNSTTRLLEVYVKRSLSLNDTCARRQRVKKTRKWVIVDSKGTRIRKASSDSSTHRLSQQSNTDQPKEPSKDTVRGSKTQEIKRKVTRKPSILRSFLSLFSRKTNEVAIAPVPESPGSSGSNDSCFTSDPCPAPVPEKVHEEKDRAIPHRAKSIKKKLSLKKLSFRNHDADKSDSVRRQTSLATADVVRVKDAIVCVEPSTVYFEKVSEELERIVKEVKESPVEEHEDLSPAVLTEEQPSEVVTDSPEDIIERMVAILKQEGDVIDAKEEQQFELLFPVAQLQQLQATCRSLRGSHPRSATSEHRGPPSAGEAGLHPGLYRQGGWAL